jgi:hypothetical protein
MRLQRQHQLDDTCPGRSIFEGVAPDVGCKLYVSHIGTPLPRPTLVLLGRYSILCLATVFASGERLVHVKTESV